MSRGDTTAACRGRTDIDGDRRWIRTDGVDDHTCRRASGCHIRSSCCNWRCIIFVLIRLGSLRLSRSSLPSLRMSSTVASHLDIRCWWCSVFARVSSCGRAYDISHGRISKKIVRKMERRDRTRERYALRQFSAQRLETTKRIAAAGASESSSASTSLSLSLSLAVSLPPPLSVSLLHAGIGLLILDQCSSAAAVIDVSAAAWASRR
jgi:hypothetical protein